MSNPLKVWRLDLYTANRNPQFVWQNGNIAGVSSANIRYVPSLNVRVDHKPSGFRNKYNLSTGIQFYFAGKLDLGLFAWELKDCLNQYRLFGTCTNDIILKTLKSTIKDKYREFDYSQAIEALTAIAKNSNVSEEYYLMYMASKYHIDKEDNNA